MKFHIKFVLLLTWNKSLLIFYHYVGLFKGTLQNWSKLVKKLKLWRSQIYIKLTLSNNDDSRKHPLKYFCLKCHIHWKIKNPFSRFIHFCFDINASQNLKSVFPLFSRDPDGRPISNFYRCVSLCTCDDGLHKVLTLQELY